MKSCFRWPVAISASRQQPGATVPAPATEYAAFNHVRAVFEPEFSNIHVVRAGGKAPYDSIRPHNVLGVLSELSAKSNKKANLSVGFFHYLRH